MHTSMHATVTVHKLRVGGEEGQQQVRCIAASMTAAGQIEQLLRCFYDFLPGVCEPLTAARCLLVPLCANTRHWFSRSLKSRTQS